MARAEEAVLVADFETVDGWIQPFSGKKRAERPEALIETVDGTRILYYPGRSKQPGYRPFPPAESHIMDPDLRSRILRYGRQLQQQDFRPIRFPLMDLRQQTPACYRKVGIRSEHAAAAAGSSRVAATGTKAEVKGGSFFKHPAADPSASGIKTDQVTQGSLLKRPRKDLGMSTGSLLLNKPNPALDSSAESAGTTAEVKGGSFFKHPAADPSATGEFSGSRHLPTVNSSHSASRWSDEVKGGSVLKRPRVDLGESNHGLGSEPCSTSSSY